MSAVAGPARRTGPIFGLTYVLICALLVFFGFSFTILTRVVESLRPWILYVHVATAAAWLVLVVVQAWLARSRKLALHRRLGEYGFVLGVLAAISAFATSLVLRHEDVLFHGNVLFHGSPGRAARIAFLAVPLNGAIAFSVLLACAYAWRIKPDVHRRCMLMAAAVLTLPAVARIPVIGKSDLWSNVPTLSLLLVLCVADLWRNKHLHKAYLVGVPALIALHSACNWLAEDAPAWWVKTAAWLCHVPVA
jgi:uncharacterized membrane protein YozB (DUF420 family)